MDSFSIWHWIIVALTVMLVVGAGGLGVLMWPVLVPKKIYLSSDPQDDGSYIEIVGRPSGIVSWLFSLLKIEPNFSLKVFFEKIEFKSVSIFGYRTHVLPADSISHTFFGFEKPFFKALYWFSIFFIPSVLIIEHGRSASSGFIFLGIFGILIGLTVAALIFILNKTMVIGVNMDGGSRFSLTMKRSVIENIDINENQLEKATEIILEIIKKRGAE